MKEILHRNWLWNRAMVLGLLASVGTPLGRVAAQSNGPTGSVATANVAVSNSIAAANFAASAAQTWTEPHSSGPPHDVVVFGHSTVLPAGETANDMVVIGGSATALGRVRGDLVSILGNVTVSNEANGDVVAILGNVKVGTNVVVRGDTVAVLGNIEMAANAKVRGDVVAVGGAVERGEGSVVNGEVVGMPGFKWLGEWLEQCVFKLRPLAPGLGWLWALTGVMLVIYLLIAIAFPRPVQACVDEITRRPVTTVLIGLLTKILVPFVLLILVATGVGVFVVPFLMIALMVAGMIGKIGLLQYVGQQIGRQVNLTALERPLLAFLLGWVILTLLFLVPVLGFIVYALTGMWALGAAVMAIFSGRRRETREKPAAPAPPGTGAQTAHPSSSAMAAVSPELEPAVPPGHPEVATAGTPDPASAPTAPPLVAPMSQTAAVPTTTIAPPTHELLSYPKAGFWERMGAAFLDMVIIGVITGIAHGPLGFLLMFVSGPPIFFIIALAYFAGLWAWKGTTFGGIVLKLHVVRTDGQPVTFLTAVVRGLAAAFSVICLFLGFLWIAWDADKQGWHDKIAGTIVVRLPRSLPLVCV